MKDFVDRFAYSDFAVYFFPGLFFMCGLVPLLLTTSAKSTVLDVVGKLGIAEAVVVLPIAYAVGGILAGFRPSVVRLFSVIFWWHNSDPKPRASIFPKTFAPLIHEAFCSVCPRVSSSIPWNMDHFHCARAWIEEHHPAIAVLARRQNALASFRENLILPALVWCTSGVVWAWKNQPSTLAKGVFALSLLAALFVPWTLLQRARLNREREVREVCLGVLIAKVDHMGESESGH
jgi:hypothetical protein